MRIVRGRMPTLEMVNERFARQLRVSIYNLLRRTVEIAVGQVSMKKFSEYTHSLSLPVNLNLVKINPLRGTALFVIDPKLVFAMVDNFFGGVGRQAKIEGREFTRHRDARGAHVPAQRVRRHEGSLARRSRRSTSST